MNRGRGWWRVYQAVRYQGVRWLLFRAVYAAKRRTGWFRFRFPIAAWQHEPAGRIREGLSPVAGPRGDGLGSPQAVCRAERILAGRQLWFSRHEFEVGFPPDWFYNPWDAASVSPPAAAMREAAVASTGHVERAHWSQIGDFAAGDIKGVWEQSRFGFVYPLVRAFAHAPDARYVEAFWEALEDWQEKNPPHCGVHWKCGQEIALRMIAWTFGFLAFRAHPATTCRREALLAEMLDVSARRIEGNLGYALSQKNNHGVSEATGLLTAGHLLSRPAWAARGRRLLETLAEELIYADGSFSQHSANYHRLMLHLYVWAIRLDQAAGQTLSVEAVDRVRRAGVWLRTLLCPETGQVPNLGGNDGAHLLDLTDLGYGDFRPTVQAVGLVTENRRWLPPGPWDELADWLGLSDDASGGGERVPEPAGGSWQEFADGGYAVWRADSLVAMLRCPRRFRHRPSQQDLLHFDLWHQGRNLLRDAGAYSYHCEEPWAGYFASSAAHNTIRFDDRDPMPRISRFLYGGWPTGEVDLTDTVVTARFRDHRGVDHRRRVERTAGGFVVSDEIGGDFREAVLRWRLDPDQAYDVAGASCRSPRFTLAVAVQPPETAATFRLAEGWESLYYQEKTPLPVFEVRVGAGCRRLITEIAVAR
ncbi:MAG: heparinase [Candidatus Anammoximicrobium sp.]|nr:heparinase [Candidatus Anammoximicrobium sp.]